MIVALTHRLLDVHPDDVISDYLRSNQAWDFDHHGGLVASWIAEEDRTRSGTSWSAGRDGSGPDVS